MSGQLESALVIQLVESIKWDSALAPVQDEAVMTPVDLDAPLDVTKYARRDRELAYRDLINAAAILKVSLETETVYSAPILRPKLQGVTTEVLPQTIDDLGQVNSQVIHVKNSSVPKDAITADKDLAGRDALVYEVLARACRTFSNPPISPNDPSGTLIPDTSAWSLAEYSPVRADINTALPLNRDLFKFPDQNLASRDNQIAAYVSRLVQILKNPFAFANRIYVKFEGTDERELEVYSLIRIYFDASVVAQPDDEVFHVTSWWRAQTFTQQVPGTGSDWKAIDGPTRRTFTAEPAFQGRNRLIYDTTAKTLQWISPSATVIHIPQIVALSIPGAFPGQTITTVPTVPSATDAQFWRLKAGQVSYEGTLAFPVEGYHDSTHIMSGVPQTDTIGFTAPNSINIPFVTPIRPHDAFRVSALVKPSQTVDIFGGYNNIGLTGTLQGATFTGNFEPSSDGLTPGLPLPFSLTLPTGSWLLSLEYTNLGSVTSGFGTKVRWENKEILSDASPLLFQDSGGNPLTDGALVQSNPVSFIASGGQSTLEVQWTYGAGALHLRTLKLKSTDVRIGRYSMISNVLDSNDVTILPTSGTEVPAVDALGERDIPAVMSFEFVATGTALAPTFVLSWLPTTDQMPLQVRQVDLARVQRVNADPAVGGFLSWKQECVNRAQKSVQRSFSKFLFENARAGNPLPDFTTDGTLWDKNSTDRWMAAIETYQPRLRELSPINEIVDGRQYQVISGQTVYNDGTFTPGMKFFGTTIPNVLNYGILDQVGAFTLSFPGHIGKPALVPLGLYFDGKFIKQFNPTNEQIPLVQVLQPWMIEAGIYVAQNEFWSPDRVNTGLPAGPNIVDRYPDTINSETGFFEGEYNTYITAENTQFSIFVGTGSVHDVIHMNSGTDSPGGTMTVSVFDGSVADIIFFGTGTEYGTLSVSVFDGSVADVVFYGTGTESGTMSISTYTGSVSDVIVDGGQYLDYGTMTTGFYSGAYV